MANKTVAELATIQTPKWKQPWLVFLLSATLVFLIPSIFGHPLASGDNLIQFNPLRVLSGNIASQGNLPLWNKFAWSGTPLLAGFNAGFYLPTSWLYIFLPSQIAWGFTQAIPYFLAALGFYNLTREYSISKFTSLISGLMFAYSGVMIAQGVHLDMITGISLAPWMLLCTKRLIEGPPTSRLKYSLSLAILYSFVVLAGAPEAMLDELIMLLVFAIVELYRFRAKWLVKILWLVAAGLIALGISAAQWIPGLAFQKISQRSAPTLAFVSFGAFAPQYFFSIFSPYLFGGPGAFNIPSYFGPFNWEEVIIYPTVGPIIALFSTISQIIKRTLDSKLSPYVAMAIVSVTLALGSHTPLEGLLYHVPLYGKQRLSGRNILVFDLCLFVFFAFWLDKALKAKYQKKVRLALLTFSPALISSIIFLLFIFKSHAIETFFMASAPSSSLTIPIKIEIFLIQLSIMIISGLAYYEINREPKYRTKSFLVFAIILDIIAFNVFGMLGTPSYSNVFNSSTKQMAYLHSLIGNGYRFALYNPNLYNYNQVINFGEPNLNISAKNKSIQGYSSLALNNYQLATGSHAQATFDPTLLDSSLINSLGTKVILTNWRYLITRYGAPILAPIPDLHTRGSSKPNALTKSSSPYNKPTETYGYFGKVLNVNGIDIHLPPNISAKAIEHVGLLQSNGSTISLSKSNSSTAPRGALHFGTQNSTPTPAVGLLISELLPTGYSDPNHSLAVGVGANSTQGYFALTGVLSKYLTYPHYIFNKTINGTSIFINSQAMPILDVSSPNLRILSHHTSLNGTLTIDVEATKASSIYWAETYAPGWKIAYHAAGSSNLKINNETNQGVTQKIYVPKGNWRITVYYHPSSIYTGLEISAATLIIFLLLVFTQIKKSRSAANAKAMESLAGESDQKAM